MKMDAWLCCLGPNRPNKLRLNRKTALNFGFKIIHLFSRSLSLASTGLVLPFGLLVHEKPKIKENKMEEKVINFFPFVEKVKM